MVTFRVVVPDLIDLLKTSITCDKLEQIVNDDGSAVGTLISGSLETWECDEAAIDFHLLLEVEEPRQLAYLLVSSFLESFLEDVVDESVNHEVICSTRVLKVLASEVGCRYTRDSEMISHSSKLGFDIKIF